MKLFKYFDKQIKKLNSFDITILKWLAFMVGVLAGAYYSAFVLNNIVYFTVAIVVLIVIWVYVFFSK